MGDTRTAGRRARNAAVGPGRASAPLRRDPPCLVRVALRRKWRLRPQPTDSRPTALPRRRGNLQADRLRRVRRQAGARAVRHGAGGHAMALPQRTRTLRGACGVPLPAGLSHRPLLQPLHAERHLYGRLGGRAARGGAPLHGAPTSFTAFRVGTALGARVRIEGERFLPGGDVRAPPAGSRGACAAGVGTEPALPLPNRASGRPAHRDGNADPADVGPHRGAGTGRVRLHPGEPGCEPSAGAERRASCAPTNPPARRSPARST